MLPSPLLIKFKNKKLISFLVFFLSVILIYKVNDFLYTKFDFRKWWWYSNMFTYLPAYMFGVYLGLNFPRKIIFEEYDKNKSIILGALLGVFSLVLTNFSLINIYMIHIIEVISIWLILNSCLFKKTPTFIFSTSFFIYVIHQPILIPLITNLYHSILDNSPIYDYQFILIKTIGSIIIILIVYVLVLMLKNILPQKVFSILSGNRA